MLELKKTEEEFRKLCDKEKKIEAIARAKMALYRAENSDDTYLEAQVGFERQMHLDIIECLDEQAVLAKKLDALMKKAKESTPSSPDIDGLIAAMLAAAAAGERNKEN